MSSKILASLLICIFLAATQSIGNDNNNEKSHRNTDILSGPCNDVILNIKEQLSLMDDSSSVAVVSYVKSYIDNKPANRCQLEVLHEVIQYYKEKIPVSDSILCMLNTTYGAILRTKGGKENIKKSLTHLEQALQYGKSSYADTAKQMYVIYSNIGDTYNHLKDPNNTIAYTDTAMYITGYEKSNPRKRRYYRMYCKAYSKIGDEFLTLAYSDLNDLYEEVRSTAYQDKAVIEKSDILCRLKKYKEAKSALLPLSKKYLHGNIKSTYSNIIVTNLYDIYKNLKEYKNAEDILIKYYKTENNTSRLIGYYNNIAAINSDQNRYNKAAHFYQKVINLCVQKNVNGESNNSLNIAYNNLIYNYNNQEKYDSAYYFLRSKDELIERSKNINAGNIWEKMRWAKQDISALLGAYKIDSSKIELLHEADKRFHKIDQEISKQINSYSDDKNIVNILSKRRELYDQYMHICYELHHLTGNSKYIDFAMATMEKNRSIILLANAQKKRISQDTSLFRKIETLKDSITKNLIKMKDKSQDYDIRILQSRVICNQLRKLRQYNKSELKPKYSKEDLISIQDYSHRNFIAYHNVITEDSIFYRICHLDLQMSFDKISLSEKDSKTIKYNLDTDHIELKGKLNIDTLSKLILPDNLPQKITIVADGILAFLPFELMTYRGEYLIYHTNVSYAFSMSHLSIMEDMDSPKKSDINCYAPSYSTKLKNNSSDITADNRSKSADELRELKYNQEEIGNIQKYFNNAQLYKGTEASKTEFLQSTSDAALIHIAAHATASSTDGENYIYFSPSDDTTNHSLSLEEIYNLYIPADLVTLSACETTLGDDLKSEGILSLSRAFAYAGSKSVISSLWKVDDYTTSIIMNNLYKYLSQGLPKDVALRQAKLDYLTNEESPVLRHPYYWAGFVAIGDMSPIRTHNTTGLPFLIAALAIIFIITILWNRRQL